MNHTCRIRRRWASLFAPSPLRMKSPVTSASPSAANCTPGGMWLLSLLLVAEASAQVTVSITAPSVGPGGVTLASVTVSQAAGFAGADIAITLPDFISAGLAETAPAVSDFLVASRSQPGRIEIAMARATGLANQSSEILRIPLSIGKSAPAGAFALVFDRLQLYDAQPSPLPGTALDGAITVAASAADEDEDGLPDRWEMQHFGNLAANPAHDSDRDGSSDYHEFLAGTDPRAADSVFRILNVQNSSGATQPSTVIRWEAREGRNYGIQWSDGPIEPNMNWHKVYNPVIRNHGGVLSWTDDGTRTHSWPEAARERYYRIVIISEE